VEFAEGIILYQKEKFQPPASFGSNVPPVLSTVSEKGTAVTTLASARLSLRGAAAAGREDGITDSIIKKIKQRFPKIFLRLYPVSTINLDLFIVIPPLIELASKLGQGISLGWIMPKKSI